MGKVLRNFNGTIIEFINEGANCHDSLSPTGHGQMKNQYFGDINDYRKYGLLRILSGGVNFKTAVCWMLTPPDGRSDGRFIDYLDEPKDWRGFDPELFDHLRGAVLTEGVRSVNAIESSTMLPETYFYSEIVSDIEVDRKQYFSTFLETAKESDLVFFDPDNGMEVQSAPFGRKNSSKYLFWHEVIATYEQGHSLLIYQHFRRQERTQFIRKFSAEFEDKLSAPEVFSFRTKNVVFFLIPQKRHLEVMTKACVVIAEGWQGQIAVDYHNGGIPDGER